MMLQIPLIFLLFVVGLAAGMFDERDDPSLRLVEEIFDPTRHNPVIRPVRNASRTVPIGIRMNLYQILEVNEPNQNIELYVWITQFWKDEYLGWDPIRFGGLQSIVLPYDRVWLPDTYLYNSLEMERHKTERWISVILTTERNESTGLYGQADVRFQYPAIYKFSCRMYILYFPFDMQNCTLTFGSWTYDIAGIDYYPVNEGVLFESFVPNEEWAVNSFTMKKHVIKYDCCEIPYCQVKMYLVVQRKSLYYLVNLVIPTAIITLIAVIGFFTPASNTGERSEKVNLGITTLLAMSILLLMVSDQMPTTSNFIPLIGWYFLAIIILTSLGTAITSFVILIQQQGHYGKQVSEKTKKIVFWKIAPVLCMSIPEALKEDKSMKRSSSNFNAIDDGVEPLMSRSCLTSSDVKEVPTGIVNLGTYLPKNSIETSMSQHLKEIKRQLRRWEGVFEEKGREEVLLLEWEFLTNVIDRALLIFFVSAVLIVTLGFISVGLLTHQVHNAAN